MNRPWSTSTRGRSTPTSSSRAEENPGGRMRRAAPPRQFSAWTVSNYARARLGYDRNNPPGPQRALCASRTRPRLLARQRGSRARSTARAGARSGAFHRERGLTPARPDSRSRSPADSRGRRTTRGRLPARERRCASARVGAHRCATARAVIWAWVDASALERTGGPAGGTAAADAEVVADA